MINFDFSLFVQLFAPAIAIVAIYYLYVLPWRIASADRWRTHEVRTRRAHGCQRCGQRVWPGEYIFCCGECESDYRWCEACYRNADLPHLHPMFRELIYLEPDVSPLERVDSVPHALLTALTMYSPRYCLGARTADAEFEWLTYAQVRRLSVAFARRLLARHRVGDILWLMASPTCGPARFIAQYGALIAGLLVVPLHATTTAETLVQIAQRAPPKCVVADLDAVRDRLPLTALAAAEVLDVAAALDGDDFESDDDIERHIVQFARQPNRYAMLLPSSGSTGVPKLTITTDGMVMQQVIVPRMGADHCLLAHQSELNQTLDMLCKGGRIGTATALDEIELDLKALRPSVHGAVPVFWQGLKCRYEQMVVDAGGDAELALQRFRRLKLLGNRCTIAIVGGAKCSKQLKDFIWQAFECVVTDGYGATEVGGLAANGNVSAAVELRLIDAPDVGYMTTDMPPRGEIVARSKRISPGYFGDDEETRRNFVDLGGERFYRTGDIGTLEGGRVTVIDRRGALCKLAQGVFVAPSRLESLFEAEPEIASCFVYGNSDMFNVTAVVKMTSESAGVVDALAAMRRAAERRALKAFERPVSVVVDSSDWSDLYTSIGKKQRARFAERFGARLTAPPELLQQAASTTTTGGGHTLCSGLVALINAHLVSVQGRAASLSPALTLAELGADSLALARLSAAIKEQMQREIPMAQLAKLTLEALQNVLFAGQSLGTALLASSAIDWQAEAERAVAEVPPPANTAARSSRAAAPCVVLTGCTGFLGAFLLRRLLDEDERTIVVCLIRCTSADASLFGRITDTMQLYGRTLSVRDLARVRPMRGDLALPRFGLVAEDWSALVAELASASSATVLHNGATVSSASSFGALRAANVLGTLTALRLAEASGAFFCHVSSVGFLGGQLDEAPIDASRLALEVLSGYAQSKCVAELALQAAQPRVPTLVVRCGTVSGASSDGAANQSDSVMNLMLGLARERIVVSESEPSPFPRAFAMMPVDTTADVIVRLTASRAVGVVNLLCRKQMSFDAIVAAVRSECGAVAEIDAAQFRARVDAIDDRAHPWFTLKSVLASTVSSFATTRDDNLLPHNERVRALMPTAVDRAPTVDDMRRMLRWLLSQQR